MEIAKQKPKKMLPVKQWIHVIQAASLAQQMSVLGSLVTWLLVVLIYVSYQAAEGCELFQVVGVEVVGVNIIYCIHPVAS